MSGKTIPGVDPLDRPARRSGEPDAQFGTGPQTLDVFNNFRDVARSMQHRTRLVRESLGDLTATARDDRYARSGVLENLEWRKVEEGERRVGRQPDVHLLEPARDVPMRHGARDRDGVAR